MNRIGEFKQYWENNSKEKRITLEKQAKGVIDKNRKECEDWLKLKWYQRIFASMPVPNAIVQREINKCLIGMKELKPCLSDYFDWLYSNTILEEKKK